MSGIRKFTVLIMLLPLVVQAQEHVFPLDYNPVLLQQPAHSGSRDIGLERDTLCLPFFDDFSNLHAFLDSVSTNCGDSVFNTDPSMVYPNHLFWMDSLAYVNNTYPILPPSYGVATLDGLRANGRPHSELVVNYAADTLTSRPLFLGGGTVDTVYLSFYYQPGGFGDFPEENDSLLLEFKDMTGDWNRVWFARNTEGDFNQPFKIAMVPVSDALYLYDGFQFRFRNWAAVQGNNDHWNIDYVYLDEDRSYDDTLFRDVSFTGPPTSFLKRYRQMPWNQFKVHQAAELDDTHLVQIINNFNTIVNTSYQYEAYETFTKDIVMPLTAPITINFDPFSTNFNIYNTFNILSSTPGYEEDSMSLTFKYLLDPAGDVQRLNDTMLYRQDFYNYFAYDDGSAEKAYALNGTGSKLAVRFHANEPDTLKEIYIHWAYVDGPKSTLFFSLMVWDAIDTTGASADESILYQQDFLSPKYVDVVNGFYVYQLTDFFGNPTPVVVDGDFFVGWLQTQSDFLNVGFDVNSNANNQVFYSTGGNWQQSAIPGAVMIRPQVGSDYSVFTGWEEELYVSSLQVFPNPTQQTLNVNWPGQVQADYSIFDMTGRVCAAGRLGSNIDVSTLATGIYFLETRENGRRDRIQFVKN